MHVSRWHPYEQGAVVLMAQHALYSQKRRLLAIFTSGGPGGLRNQASSRVESTIKPCPARPQDGSAGPPGRERTTRREEPQGLAALPILAQGRCLRSARLIHGKAQRLGQAIHDHPIHDLPIERVVPRSSEQEVGIRIATQTPFPIFEHLLRLQSSGGCQVSLGHSIGLEGVQNVGRTNAKMSPRLTFPAGRVRGI